MIHDICIPCADRGYYICQCGNVTTGPHAPSPRTDPPEGDQILLGVEEAGRRRARFDRFWHGLNPVALPPPLELDSIIQRPANLARGEHHDALDQP